METENLLGGSFEMLSGALDMAWHEHRPPETPSDVLARFAAVSRYSAAVAERIAAHPVTRTLLPYLGTPSRIPARLYLASWARELQLLDRTHFRNQTFGDTRTPHNEAELHSGVSSGSNDGQDKEYAGSDASWIAVQQTPTTSLPQVEIVQRCDGHGSCGDGEANATTLVQQRVNAAINSPLINEDSIEDILKSRKAHTVLDDVVHADTSLGVFEILSTQTTPPPPQPKRGCTVQKGEWLQFINGHSSSSFIRRRIFAGGCEIEIRKDVWKFMFGVFPWDSSQDERERIMERKIDEYYRLKREWISKLSLAKDESCPPIVGTLDPEFQTLKDSLTRIEKDVLRTDRNHPFYTNSVDDAINDTCCNSPTDCSSGSSLARLRSVLMTYAHASHGLGYVQGMSDLCSPVLVALQGDEVGAFWCFYGMMEKMKDNFRRDGAGMRKQLESMERLVAILDPPLHAHLTLCDATNMFFVFRFLLVAFKREFAFEDTLILWEAIWTNPYTPDFHLFVALAVLEKASRDIMYLRGLDEILKYVNSLAQKMDLVKTLEEAEFLCFLLHRKAANKNLAVFRWHACPSGGEAEAEEKDYGRLFTLDSILSI
ncbi:hypothetical protein SeMB42_g06627 [Synchytrium endobioticum]|nr:hypothetical protein SeMB42_g06627 [Synchytrium endobioticum]